MIKIYLMAFEYQYNKKFLFLFQFVDRMHHSYHRKRLGNPLEKMLLRLLCLFLPLRLLRKLFFSVCLHRKVSCQLVPFSPDALFRFSFYHTSVLVSKQLFWLHVNLMDKFFPCQIANDMCCIVTGWREAFQRLYILQQTLMYCSIFRPLLLLHKNTDMIEQQKHLYWTHMYLSTLVNYTG